MQKPEGTRATGPDNDRHGLALELPAEAQAQLCEDLARARLVKSVVAFAMQVPLAALDAVTRGDAQAALARQVAMYLTHVTFSLSLARTARAFFRDRSTVSHACHRIEDKRESERFDIWIAGLEEMLGAAPERSSMRPRVSSRSTDGSGEARP